MKELMVSFQRYSDDDIQQLTPIHETDMQKRRISIIF